MKTKLFGILIIISCTLSLSAASLTVAVPPGTSLLANPFNNSSNTADILIPNPDGLLDGDLLYVYNCSGGFTRYTLDSSFSTGFGDIFDAHQVPPPVLAPGRGFYFVHFYDAMTITFTGTVPAAIYPSSYACGCDGYSSLGALNTNSSSYQDYTGVPPVPGSQVLICKPQTAAYPFDSTNYIVYTFTNGSSTNGWWIPGNPPLAPGVGAVFYTPCNDFIYHDFLGYTGISATNSSLLYVWSSDVMNEGSLKMFTTNSTGTTIADSLHNLTGAVGLACDNVGNSYAGVNVDVYKFTPTGTKATFGKLDSICALAFDGTGNLYCAIPNYDAVYGVTVTSNSPYLGVSAQTGSNVRVPASLAFSPAGNLYVANGTNYFNYGPNPTSLNTIEMFNTNLTHLGTFSSGLNLPAGLAFDSGGNLYVANSGTSGKWSNTILKINPDGFISIFANEAYGLSRPCGLAFDRAGNLFVANAGNGTIEEFYTDGTVGVIVSGLIAPVSISIYPGLNDWSSKPFVVSQTKLSQPGGGCQIAVKENPRLSISAWASSDLSLPLTNWINLGQMSETSSGFYEFTDLSTTNNQRFYRISSP